jgi:hypothetical protein
VVDAQYAFVLHTRNPVTGAADEMMGEVVVGLGEALVGNYPGRALGFVAPKAAGGAAAVSRFPSKRTGLFLPAGEGGTLIFRSDSNGEDLEGFAGAGLYDSVMAVPAAERPVDYEEERLLFDDAFRADLLGKLAAAGRAVEAAMGGAPQDIEGAVRDGVVYIVQTRPQVFLANPSTPARPPSLPCRPRPASSGRDPPCPESVPAGPRFPFRTHATRSRRPPYQTPPRPAGLKFGCLPPPAARGRIRPATLARGPAQVDFHLGLIATGLATAPPQDYRRPRVPWPGPKSPAEPPNPWARRAAVEFFPGRRLGGAGPAPRRVFVEGEDCFGELICRALRHG